MSAVTASILVGTKNRVDLGIQPRWIILLHEAQGYAWHLLRLQLSGGDVANSPLVSLAEKGPPGTRQGLDSPPGILWRAAPDGDIVGELALLLHLHCLHTPEILAAVRRIDPLSRRRVNLASLGDAQRGDLLNAIRIARDTGGGLYLAATILAGSRLTEEALLALPEWEINLATTVLSRDWIRVDHGYLETTDYRTPSEPPVGDPGHSGHPGDLDSPGHPGGSGDPGRSGGPDGPGLSGEHHAADEEPPLVVVSPARTRVQRRERELEEQQRAMAPPPEEHQHTWLDGFFREA